MTVIAGNKYRVKEIGHIVLVLEAPKDGFLTCYVELCNEHDNQRLGRNQRLFINPARLTNGLDTLKRWKNGSLKNRKG